MTGRGTPPLAEAPPPEPTFAERARTLVHLGRTGMLATLSTRHAGYPFGSVMPYALDGQGRPVVLISSLAVHTRNLNEDPRASLLVLEAPMRSSPRVDPLALGRVTLMGEAGQVPAAEASVARAGYLARHPEANSWVDFGDFGFWRLEVRDVYVVGGFAAMDWVDAGAYAGARPDPLADVAAGIVEHMNEDHGDALLTLARVFAGVPAEEASMVSVDRLGFKLRVKSGSRLQSLRIPFPRAITSADQSRAALIEMVEEARRRAAARL